MYHLSAWYLGQNPILAPKLPRDPMPFENLSIKRICVSPTVNGCLTALHTTFYNRGVWYVYRTNTQAIEPINVPDAYLTGEQWLINKTGFIYEGRIQVDVSCPLETNELQKIDEQNKADYYPIFRNGQQAVFKFQWWQRLIGNVDFILPNGVDGHSRVYSG